ncbi:FG-GAP repeat protein [bacterium]|nr:FG-GAP repeat protein [bacterium]
MRAVVSVVLAISLCFFSNIIIWAEDCEQKTPQPNLTYIATVVDDTIVGNGNGVMEPGETVQLQVALYNAGTATAFGVMGMLESQDIGVTVTDRNATFGDIMPGSSVTAVSPYFTVSLGTSVSCGKDVTFQFQAIYLTGSSEFSFTVPMRGSREHNLAASEYDEIIYGAAAGDHVGTSVGHGDINGDGLEDIVFGAYQADGPGDVRSSCGEVWVIYGSTNPDFTLDLNTPPASATLIYGAGSGDELGFGVGVGDLNGDGFDDLVMSARSADGEDNLRAQCGEVWIIPGSSALSGTTIDLTSPPTGSRVIYGADASDYLASDISVDDFNGDGFDDVLLGAWNADGPGNGRNQAGEVWFIPGPIIKSTIDLVSPPAYATVIYGADSNDFCGEDISSGDINGDGKVDCIIAARASDGFNNDESGAGEVWIIYGAETFPAVIDLATPAQASTVIYGDDATDNLGMALASGDINHDGYDDVVAGAWWGDGPGNTRSNAGDVWVIYGAATLPTSINLDAQPPNTTAIFGGEEGDLLGDTLGCGDVNGDGYDDLVLAAVHGDGLNNATANAGDIWLIYGQAVPPMVVDLSSPPFQATVFYGMSESDGLANSIDVADLDSDGYEDILLGNDNGDGADESLSYAGEIILITGRPSWAYYLRADTYSWIDAMTGQNIGLDCDSCCQEVEMGFSFEFYGDSYSSIWVCDDGYISFAEVTMPHSFNFCLPSKYLPQSMIAVNWNDFSLEESGAVYALLEGTEPNRRFTVEWSAVPYYSLASMATFELTLFEGSNQILVQYGSSFDSGLSSTAGLENMTGTNGHSYSCYEDDLTAGSAWRAVPFGTYSIFYDDMESGTNGWTSSGLWHQEAASCEPFYRSTTTSWYFGDSVATPPCSYETGVRETGLLNTPTISADFYSQLYYWQRRETEAVSNFDLSYIQVSEDGGAFTDIDQIFNVKNAWEPDRVDISSHSNHDLALGFFFDTVDTYGNEYLGWMLDNIEVLGCEVFGGKAMKAYAYARPTPVCETESYLLDGTGTFVLGCDSISYQWFEDGSALDGATFLQYSIPPGHAPGLFTYTFGVSCASPFQSETSEPVEVLVVEMPSEVPEDSFMLEKSTDGSEITMTWQDVSGGEFYVVFNDSNPAGSFETELAGSSSGSVGLTVAMPTESIVYYLVAGANDTCGLGPKR